MSGASTTTTREVTIAAPSKTVEEQKPHRTREETKSVSLPDGPSLAFTPGAVRLYDSSQNTYRELTNAELVEILANIYGVD